MRRHQCSQPVQTSPDLEGSSVRGRVIHVPQRQLQHRRDELLKTQRARAGPYNCRARSRTRTSPLSATYGYVTRPLPAPHIGKKIQKKKVVHYNFSCILQSSRSPSTFTRSRHTHSEPKPAPRTHRRAEIAYVAPCVLFVPASTPRCSIVIGFSLSPGPAAATAARDAIPRQT